VDEAQACWGQAVLELQQDLQNALDFQAELNVLISGLQGRRTQLGCK